MRRILALVITIALCFAAAPQAARADCIVPYDPGFPCD